MHDLYDKDIYAWSQYQAAILRGLRAGRDLPNDLDLEHVAEEIEDVGNAQLSAVESFLRFLFIHLMKAACARSDEPKLHWRSEMVGHHVELVSRFRDSMRKDIDLDLLWTRAFRQAKVQLEERGDAISPLLKRGCPFDLDHLLEEDIDPDQFLARLKRIVAPSEEQL